MRRLSLLLVFALLAALLGGCRFAVVESDAVQVGGLFAASAEEAILSLGSRDEGGSTSVASLQNRLAAMGYLGEEEEADGIFGSGTQQAVKAFQKDKGLEPTGEVDIATQVALYSANNSEDPETDGDTLLTAGSYGEEVENVQRALRTYGFSAEEVSGTYDEATGEAVKTLQEYAVERYGTEFDEPNLEDEPDLLPVSTPAPSEFTTAFAVVEDEMFTPEMAAPTPEPTLRPSYPVDGTVSETFYNYLLSGKFPAYHQTVGHGDSGIEVLRLQNRLSTLQYFYDTIDGSFGHMTEEALKMFQRVNRLQETGIADAETQALLYSDGALDIDRGHAVDMPYYIKVSLEDQEVYVYRCVDGEYDYLIRSMTCSTGAVGHATPTGVFTSTGRRDGRWHYFIEHKCWAQYAFVITGNILFHSILYSAKDESTIRMSSVYNLGHRASHGCVRLAVEDAKWICMHCKAGQKVEIY